MIKVWSYEEFSSYKGILINCVWVDPTLGRLYMLGWTSTLEPRKYGGLALVYIYVGHGLDSCLFTSHLSLFNTFFLRLLKCFLACNSCNFVLIFQSNLFFELF